MTFMRFHDTVEERGYYLKRTYGPKATDVATRGTLLVNLGSPASASVGDVRAYLDEFLMDPFVLDTPWLIRRLIVSLAILPSRPKRSAKAYASIWRDEAPGSPLLAHSIELVRAVTDLVDNPVALAMRYGQPDIDTGLRELLARGVNEVLCVPLYPQHADSTRSTVVEKVRATLTRLDPNCGLRIVPPFFDSPGYLDAVATRVRDTRGAEDDHLLFSYHGLPERHLQRTDPTGSHCLAAANCCEVDSVAHATCYRRQCFATTRSIVDRLGAVAHSVSFQSRLGRLPWLTPYTDQTLEQLPARGIKRITVVCPAFVADNLETLEEIDIAGRRIFETAGGERLTLVPCLNADSNWASTIAEWIREPPLEAAFDQTESTRSAS